MAPSAGCSKPFHCFIFLILTVVSHETLYLCIMLQNALSIHVRLYLILFWLLMSVCFLFGQVKSSAYRAMLKTMLSHSVQEVGIAAAATDSSVVFLDAREPNEYGVSHLKNALHIGYDHFELSSVQHLDKQAPIIVYCSIGYRSEKIAQKLKQSGFTNVSNLYGGIFEWVNQNHPVYDGVGKTTKIHAYSRSWGIWLKKGVKVYD